MAVGRRLGAIWYSMYNNIVGDYMEMFLITSRSMGKEPSMGKPYGVGKSTLAIWMAYVAHAFARDLAEIRDDVLYIYADEETTREILLDVVRNYLVFSIDHLLDILSNAEDRVPAIVWDDVQLTAPAIQHAPKELIEKLDYLTVARPLVSNLILTAPSITDVHRRLRRMITWEVIIPQRGVYEVQYIFKRRHFRKPSEDRERLIYDVTGFFDPLPVEVLKEYRKVRREMAKYRKAVKVKVKMRDYEDAKKVADAVLKRGYKKVTGGIISSILDVANPYRVYAVRRVFLKEGIIDERGEVNLQRLKEFIGL